MPNWKKPKDPRAKRKADPAWKLKHDLKKCVVCKRFGSNQTLFDTLKQARCNRCIAKHAYHCPIHKRYVNTHGECLQCRKKRDRIKRQKKREAEAEARRLAFERQVARLTLVTGDGLCSRCGERIREGYKVDRTHQCETP